jgi:hypothetical protein
MPSNTPKVAGVTEEKKLIPSPIVAVSASPTEKKTLVAQATKLIEILLQKGTDKKIRITNSIEVNPKATNRTQSILTDGGKHSSDNTQGGYSSLSIRGLIFSSVAFLLVIFILLYGSGNLPIGVGPGLGFILIPLLALVGIVLSIIAFNLKDTDTGSKTIAMIGIGLALTAAIILIIFFMIGIL